MGYTVTPVNGVQVPDHNELLNQVAVFSQKVAAQTEPFTVMRFDNQADLTATLVGALAPAEGMVAYIKDSDVLQLYTGSAWKRIYPVERQTYVGTTTPSASLGAVGDIYLQY